jgi:Fe-S oxidoreductase
MELRDNKLSSIESGQPEMIVTANIGCQTHLQSGTNTPVRHWLELLASFDGKTAIQSSPNSAGLLNQAGH